MGNTVKKKGDNLSKELNKLTSKIEKMPTGKSVKSKKEKSIVKETIDESKVDFASIEKKWQEAWEEKKIFEVKEDSKKKKCYVLEMYPYPSASFLHMGHVRNYTIGDVFARFKRMSGFNVLYPMGYDSFGLPAEIASKKEGIHPEEYTKMAMEKIMAYQKALGNSYDWGRTLSSHDPNYYKWNQYFFLKLFEKGLAYRKKAPVNWCEKCQSVLANEEAESGKCWRCNNEVVKKEMEQWFFKITDYADRLLEDLSKIDWPEKIKVMQRNWIGKSFGTEVEFLINGKKWPVFTTRPDTLYGVTFMVVSAQHPNLMNLVTSEQKKKVEEFVKKCMRARTSEEIENLDKEGAFTGSYAINPLTKEKVPVWIGNFVVADYGSGMVMAVPTHDKRDFEFAKKYKIPMKIVIQSKDKKINLSDMKQAFTENGILVNSDKFSGMENRIAIEEITKELEKIKMGKKTVNYKIRDWMISRQRYWGTPIPIVYCDNCGVVPVSEKDLPVLLPKKVDFKTSGNPLTTNSEFVNVKCPKCGGKGKRETDTMGGFVDSSWYFLRYCDNKNNKEAFDKKKVEYWMPVDQYVGGAEHAVMHLMYARFFIKALNDLGFVNFDEPFKKLFNQGIVYKDGAKMSKSKGNVVFQTDISNKYGIDTARLFLMFVSSPDRQMEWSDDGVEGSFRIINKLIRLKDKVSKNTTPLQEHKINNTIKLFSLNIESFDYPKAIISAVECLDSFNGDIKKENYEILLKLFSLFCPHITEELWHNLGNKTFISVADWPVADESKINAKLEEAEKNVDKTVSDIITVLNIIKEKTGKDGNKVYLYVMPFELANYDAEAIVKRTGKEIKVFAVNDKSKYDPEQKSSKAKPGKPGIFVE
ncbi:MAG: leucine--tRNA ligase [archaeon]|nr:leucine--tRNA ligase [archaeon]